MTLRTAIEALANRHQGNRISMEFGDQAIEIEGKITPAMEALLRQAQETYVAGVEGSRDSSAGGAGTQE